MRPVGYICGSFLFLLLSSQAGAQPPSLPSSFYSAEAEFLMKHGVLVESGVPGTLGLLCVLQQVPVPL
jgi:hypothetical protein